MYTVLIVLIIAIVVSIKFIIDEKDSNYIDRFIIAPLLFITSGVLVGVFIAAILPAKTTMEVHSTKYLESLGDGSNISGSTFLGSGNFEEDMHYIYYFQVGEGYKMGRISHKTVSVKYIEDGSRPRLETIRPKKIEGTVRAKWTFVTLIGEEHIFYVPKGSIKNNYNLGDF